MQTLAKNKEFVLIREKHTTTDDINFYCSKIYQKHSKKSLKDENDNDIYVLELTESGFKDGFNGECIPEGTYKIKRDRTGRFKWYKLINDELLKDDNEDIKAIEFHEGNYLKDTKGCLLFGIGFDSMRLYGSEDLIIKSSLKTLNYLLHCVFGNPNENEDQIIGTLEITNDK